jgi:hypothetical protein
VQGQTFTQSPQLFALSELLYAINGVNVSLAYDTVSVAVSVANAAGQTTTVTQNVSAS